MNTYERFSNLDNRYPGAGAKKAIKIDAKLIAALRKHPEEARVWVGLRTDELLR